MPTLPRYSNAADVSSKKLFINGELIGGCDIMLELEQSGALPRMVKEAGRV